MLVSRVDGGASFISCQFQLHASARVRCRRSAWCVNSQNSRERKEAVRTRGLQLSHVFRKEGRKSADDEQAFSLTDRAGEKI